VTRFSDLLRGQGGGPPLACWWQERQRTAKLGDQAALPGLNRRPLTNAGQSTDLPRIRRNDLRVFGGFRRSS
jgi:hypothetical protein